jgi:hypothetical protein
MATGCAANRGKEPRTVIPQIDVAPLKTEQRKCAVDALRRAFPDERRKALMS